MEMGSSRVASAKRTGLRDVVLSAVVIVGVTLILMPAFGFSFGGAAARLTNCQTNLKQIGVSFKVYLCDWDETFPTNRPFAKKNALGPIANSIKLSKVGVMPTGRPIRFEHGITWVEGLYSYMESISDPGTPSVWVCPDVRQTDSKTTGVSYVFNRNLVQEPETIIRDASTLMLVREMDRIVASDLRPVNDSVKPNQAPKSALLTDKDVRFGTTNPKLHSNGSSILFADGHVKYFDAGAYTSVKWLSKAKTWGVPNGTVTISP